MITYWDVLAVVNYSVCLVGIPVNIMYFKLVVLNQGFDGYCRSCLYPLLSSLALGAPYCASMWLLLFGIIFKDLFYEFFFFGNIVMNVNSTVFPLIFLYSSKKIRKKILRINPFRGKSAPMAFEVQNLDGERIDFIQSQNEYFQQLRTTWG
uniref:Uncharacterized protein n=1 Tax=Caenorhabditis japonica TaxID=281687 RepID=A0A8R1E464_CAEJA